MNPIVIHTDGSCETQTRLGGWAAVLQCGEHQRDVDHLAFISHQLHMIAHGVNSGQQQTDAGDHIACKALGADGKRAGDRGNHYNQQASRAG